MQTNLMSKNDGNFQTLRDMWSLKTQEHGKSSAVRSRLHSEQQKQEKKSAKINIPTVKVTNATTRKKSSGTPDNEKTIFSQSVDKLPSINKNMSLPIPPPPPSSNVFKHQAQVVGTIKRSITKMTPNEKKHILPNDHKNHGVHWWHIARVFFRSGLRFNRRRRASDSILPLLIKTHRAHHRSRSDSMDSTLAQTPFENLVDYLSYDKAENRKGLSAPRNIRRSLSDAGNCMRRNKLDDVVLQYEMLLRHVKNYERFMATYPASSLSATKQREKSFDDQLISSSDERKEELMQRSSALHRQTQSLSRNSRRTFLDFIMSDVLLSPVSKTPSQELKHVSVSHTSSQTDLAKSIDQNEDVVDNPTEIIRNANSGSIHSLSNDEAKDVLNEFDAMLDQQQLPLTPNSDINVIVRNAPDLPSVEAIPSTAKPLMQSLFEGNKSAYSPDDLYMKPIRLANEMMPVYEIAKKTCFLDNETPVYTTMMRKVRRRSYTQHIRMLSITTTRIYNLTGTKPYPKESLLFYNITGITCTPYKDGFVCIHTKETLEDRGDWLVVVDHPCELITQLFMATGRQNNDDEFLKIKTKFTHCRRFYGESSSNDNSIEVRLADHFQIKKKSFDSALIYTP